MKACCASTAPAFFPVPTPTQQSPLPSPRCLWCQQHCLFPSSLAPGGDYSSKFSAWLAHGCLSPRTVYHEIKRYERQTGTANKSTYWVIFEMIWRDFFRCVSGLSLEQGVVACGQEVCKRGVWAFEAASAVHGEHHTMFRAALHMACCVQVLWAEARQHDVPRGRHQRPGDCLVFSSPHMQLLCTVLHRT